MSIKKTKKTISGVMFGASISLMLLLSACSQSNSLKTTDPDKAAKFLVSASQAAEKQLQVFNAPGGYYYGECMMGKEKKSLCDRLYQAMVNYAKTTHDFQRLTVSNLTDQQVFKTLKVDYERERFDAI